MAARSPTRVHLVEKLEKLVETYNLGTLGVELFFEALKALVEMEEEERRAAREGLSTETGRPHRGRRISPQKRPISNRRRFLRFGKAGWRTGQLISLCVLIVLAFRV
jgi:hypothetical protein